MEFLHLRSIETNEFWAVQVLYEDEDILAIDKPALLLTSPDRYDPKRPNLMRLLHEGVTRGSGWAVRRQISYLMNAHRLDFETSGILLLAKNKPTLVALANLFSIQKPLKTYAALVHGVPVEKEFEIDAKLAPHPVRTGLMRVDPKNGKTSVTRFKVREAYSGCSLLACFPLTGRTHQIRVHLKHAGHPILADSLYGGEALMLSNLKPHYRLKPGHIESPLTGRVALHAEEINLPHPKTGAMVRIEAPWPKDLAVSVKYLRKYGSPHPAA